MSHATQPLSPSPPPLPPPMAEFLAALRREGRTLTAQGYATGLRRYARYLGTDHNPRHGAPDAADPLRATTAVVVGFREYLGKIRSRRGDHLALTTQACQLIHVKSFYAWCARTDRMLADLAAPVDLPAVPRHDPVHRDHLCLQEAVALLAAPAHAFAQSRPGSVAQARIFRDLTLMGFLLATGRRASGLIHLRCEDLDLARGEYRLTREKGRVGRVLPLSDWACALLRRYLDEFRPRLLRGRDLAEVFPGRTGPRMHPAPLAKIYRRWQRAAAAANPDLTELSHKRLTTHSFRVTFACLLFTNECPIRSVNELMLHRNLSTTARYTPLAVEDLRRACTPAHPRG